MNTLHPKDYAIEPDPTQFCAPGATVAVSMAPVDDRVSLKVFDFTPARDAGRPLVVFVAGWISLMDGWGAVLREMTRDFPVRYIETREKISSEIQGRVRHGVEEIGHDVVNLVESWGLKEGEYILLGSSLGATAILDGARFFKARPLALILIAPNAVFRVPKVFQAVIHAFWPPFYVVLRPVIKWYLRTFRMHVASDRAQYDKYCRALDTADAYKLKNAAKAVWHYEVWDKLHTITIPTLIVGASQDKLHEPENMHRMVKLMPDARYLDMETNGATHSAAMVEALRVYLDEKK